MSRNATIPPYWYITFNLTGIVIIYEEAKLLSNMDHKTV